MKHLIVFLMSSLLIISGCKKEKESEEPIVEEQTVQAEDAVESEAVFTAPELSEIDFDALADLQKQISNQPENRSLRGTFLEKAYFKSNKALVTIGVGRLTHPETGQPLSRAMVKRAAQLDANRWAAYGLSWIKNDLNPDFGNVDTTFQGLQNVLLSYDKGDSLYLAVANEIQ